MATVKTSPFEVTGADGGPLRGDVRTVGDGGGRPAVVICHGFKGFKDWGFFPHLAQRIANAGLTTVSFNFTGSGVGPDGESFSELERFGHATFSGDVTDIGIVVQALRSGQLNGVKPPSLLALFGHSRGGGTAVLYAGHHSGVDALVTWNAIGTVRRWTPDQMTDWRVTGQMDIANLRTGQTLPLYLDLLHDIEQNAEGSLNIAAAAERITAPWLIVHGEKDESVPRSEGKLLYESAGPDAKLQIVKNGAHTFGARHPWAGAPAELQQAMDLTAAFLSRHLH